MKMRQRHLVSAITASLMAASLALTPAPASAADFSLADVMSAPFTDGLIRAEGADRIAWIGYDRGIRNVWTAAAPDFDAHMITNYREDDGQVISSLALSPDGA
ncbi:MAG: hypothetical protein V3R73_07165, partial [Sphingomonadales bacterium]